MNKYICNYSVIRFTPYRETEEFVNLGIILCCPELGYTDFKLERFRQKRVFDFFPELNKLVLKEGLKGVYKDLVRIQTPDNIKQTYLFATDILKQFNEITKHRESIFRFSEPGMILTEQPNNALEKLFDDLVQRQFAQNKEYQETVMVKKLKSSMAQWNLHKFYRSAVVGNEDYNISLPFTYAKDDKIIKAIKPLNLDKDSTSKIYEHGDDWIAKINRLQRMDKLPTKLLFAVALPEQDTKKRMASDEICKALSSLNTEVLPFSSFDNIKKWAEVN